MLSLLCSQYEAGETLTTVFAPPLRKLDDRTHFHRPVGGHGNCFGNGNRLINSFCLDQEIAAQLFVRFCKWTAVTSRLPLVIRTLFAVATGSSGLAAT